MVGSQHGIAPSGDHNLSVIFLCTDVPYSCMSCLPQFRRLDFFGKHFFTVRNTAGLSDLALM